jgi:hypothetical protein
MRFSLRSLVLTSALALIAIVTLMLARPLSRPVGASSGKTNQQAGEGSPGRSIFESSEGKMSPNSPNAPPKYFHEPKGSLARVHYDLRYFTEEVSYDRHRGVLRNLIQSYLSIFDDLGIETWIAHGTLLGWWWNGAIMPWDYDVDVQVTNYTLAWLADNMNRTEHAYSVSSLSSSSSSALEGSEDAADGIEADVTTNRYLLDINPHYDEIHRDRRNVIDARWIDMQNGMFIDITGVRERSLDSPGRWSDKNNHHYESADLWPMRFSEFEGARARIPYNFEKILVDEYGQKCLVMEEWKR